VSAKPTLGITSDPHPPARVGYHRFSATLLGPTFELSIQVDGKRSDLASLPTTIDYVRWISANASVLTCYRINQREHQSDKAVPNASHNIRSTAAPDTLANTHIPGRSQISGILFSHMQMWFSHVNFGKSMESFYPRKLTIHVFTPRLHILNFNCQLHS
jgi:hypothetical protein